SHPFVHEDQARSVLDEELAQLVTRVGGAFIVMANALVGSLAAELPGELSPEGSYFCAVFLHVGLARGDLVAHQHGALDVRQRLLAGLGQQLLYALELARIRAAKQVVEGEHGVSLAATEVGLELDYRI